MKKKRSNRAAFFSPYLDTLGGGERYFFTVLQWAVKNGFKVDLFWSDSEILSQANKRFGFNFSLSEVTFSSSAYALLTQSSFWERMSVFENYDLVFFVSDGSIPFLNARGLNLIHFQVPFKKVRKGLFWFLKKRYISYFIYNSHFTQSIVQPQLEPVPSKIIYPPVEVSAFHANSVKKEKIILAVGRFDQTMQAKRQDLLIDVFKTISSQAKGWKLILAGGTTNYDHWVKPLQKQAKGYPIEFIVNPSWNQLKRLYQQATIFWHAAGYGINPYQHPERMEHFGITTVEALAAGCVPIVYNGGGLPEIIKPYQNGLLFSTPTQLADLTLQVINQKINFKTQNLTSSANKFSQEKFYQKLDKILQH